MLLTPEESIAIQNTIGADIIMQLDDVVHVLTTGDRVEEAMHRSVRWLDRCIGAHTRKHDQNLFAIIQGGLQPHLRRKCIEGSDQYSTWFCRTFAKEGSRAHLCCYTVYSGHSDKGHSERGQTSQQRTSRKYSCITLYRKSERGQPLYKGRNGWSQMCPL